MPTSNDAVHLTSLAEAGGLMAGIVMMRDSVPRAHADTQLNEP
ncbi:hypothetical protein PA08_1388 [Cutibacterium modestum P08]|nr:hypothetical protein PA08_1388 [Cutibacterium modestum P08]